MQPNLESIPPPLKLNNHTALCLEIVIKAGKTLDVKTTYKKRDRTTLAERIQLTAITRILNFYSGENLQECCTMLDINFGTYCSWVTTIKNTGHKITTHNLIKAYIYVISTDYPTLKSFKDLNTIYD